MNEDSEAQAGIKKILFLNRTNFFYEMRDVLYGEKQQTSAYVNITDVFDFIYALGLEDATLLPLRRRRKPRSWFMGLRKTTRRYKFHLWKILIQNKMGCLNSKELSEQTTPYTKKKQSRWRCIVGLEVKGLEFNAQVGLVHVGDEKFDRSPENHNIDSVR